MRIIEQLKQHRARALRRAGDRARDERRWADAATAYRRWLEGQPDDRAIWIQLGHALAESGDLAGADAVYHRASDLRADDADLLLCRGHLAKRQGDPERALDFYHASLALDGSDAAAREIAALSPEEPATPEVSAEQPAPRPADPAPAPGACEHLDREVVHGWIDPVDAEDHVRLFAGERLVGTAWPVRSQPRGDGLEFRALLSLDAAAEVRAVRASDGRELAGSPFLASPPITAQAPVPLASDVRHLLVKPLVWDGSGELALLVTHSATGAIKPHVLPYVRALEAAGIATLLIVQADRPVDVGAELTDRAAGVMLRDNRGYDFAAWAHALALHHDAWGAPTLYLLNDSVIPATGDRRLADLIGRVRASAADFVGLTESHEYRWHLQSYFLALKPGALSSFTLQHFFGAAQIVDDKDAIIRRFELPLARLAEEAGCRIEVLFPGQAALNPVLNEWDALLAQGFPFVKLLLLRGAFPHVDLSGWRDTLEQAGFDLPLIDAVLRASEESVPRDPDDRLSAHPVRVAPRAAGPLKLALYGPWNYDNGLGHAARGLVGALRHAGVRLNLHPIEKSFHVHRPLALPVPVQDFAGAADVAVVHLNPDSWHLLTDAQRDEIAAARQRVGYWVWEMGHVPEAWWQNFRAVDRIWAPSRYCAALLERADGAPVDVIPHAVPLPAGPAPDAAQRARLLRALGVDPARRLILYVFDGSSYLVRKNPAALIRAFAASALAERGWTLLLKTKHLLDRPDDGRALRALADGEAGVVLVDRALDPAALERLVRVCDIYASPHCSEGFGLTVAEAMAAGRPVVATDFGGTTDLLDATTGYPVRWHPWRLAEDHGHYTRGGEWARIDEPALAHSLLRAAAAVEAGDERLGPAACARVAERLSFDAVGQAIARSLADMAKPRPYHESVCARGLNLNAGLSSEQGTGDARVQAIALAANGAPANTNVEDEAEWLLLAPAGSRFSPLLAPTLLRHAAARPDVSIFYADDVAATVDEEIDQFRLKPAFDRTLLAAQDYIGAPVMVRADAFAALDGLDASMGTAAVADLLFRADAAGRSIARIPEILLAHPGERVRATPADYERMLQAQPALADYHILPGRTPQSFGLDRRYGPAGEPAVTLVIPTRRSPVADTGESWIERLLDAIGQVDWPMDRLTVLVGDDLADEPAWAAAPRPYPLRRIATPREAGAPFNYAAKMNRLWRAAETEQIVFMNDDLVPHGPGWLRALQTFALDRGVGGVGARLLYTDGSLQHAGIVPHGAGAAHAWLYRRRERGTFHDWALVHREWSMVTGALFATRRSLMEEVNGFDEAFTVEFNDTDLCLRLRALGYRIVCTPFAEMTHAEKISRGEVPPAGATIARFRARWAGWLADDPAFHPLLRRDRFDLRPSVSQRQWFF